MNSARHAGFTIVELVVIIIVVGIMGVVVVSRYNNPNAFNQSAATDTLLTTIRQAQQTALGRSDVTFEIASGGGQWQFLVKSGADTVRSAAISMTGVKLETGSSLATGDTCASGSSFNTAVNGFVLSFDPVGNLASFNNTGVGLEDDLSLINGVRICVNDLVAASVCVSPAGYAHRGNCEP